MEFRPRRTVGTMFGGAVAAWCIAIAVALTVRGMLADVSLGVVPLYVVASVFFGMGLLFAYWTYSLATMRYTLDRNVLTITWGDVRQLVPMAQIERLVPGRERSDPRVAGVSWIGHHVGHGEVEEGVGYTLFYSTHRSPEDLLYIVTPEQSYAISVDDEVEFAEAIQAQQRLGPLVSVPQVPQRSYLAAQPFWEDRAAQVMALVAAAAFFVMMGYIYQQYPGLPQSIPLSFPQLDGVTRVGGKEELLRFPMTGVGVLAINLVAGFVAHSWERMVGYVLLIAAAGAQGILLAGAIITLT
jgi:hypothetical protein